MLPALLFGAVLLAREKSPLFVFDLRYSPPGYPFLLRMKRLHAATQTNRTRITIQKEYLKCTTTL